MHRFGRGAPWHDPALLHALVWLVTSSTCLFFADELIQPGNRALIIVGTGIASFSAGLWFGAKWTKAAKAPPLALSAPATALLALVAGIACATVLVQAVRLAPPGGEGAWLSAVRAAASQPGHGFGFAGYLANAGFAAAFVAVLLARGRLAGLFAALAAALAVACAVLLTGRTFLLLIAVVLAVALGRRGDAPGRARLGGVISLLAIALAVTGMLIIVSYLQARSATGAGTFVGALRYEIMHYIPVGLAAFSAEIATAAPLQNGVNTFRTALAVLRALGADVPVVVLVRPWVPVPFLTNVYTVFSPYHADFGWPGVVVALAGFGLLTGHAAIRARTGRPVAVMLHAILIYALFMQFFQDQYASLASQWVQLLALAFVFALPARRAG
jgi:oligosaccharide repeat unit polymerase